MDSITKVKIVKEETLETKKDKEGNKTSRDEMQKD